jgi:hypothetical protein
MKSKILLVGILIVVLLLTGCVVWTFNLCTWSSSNAGFNNLISTLNTPEKAVNWLKANCNYVKHTFPYSPYQVYSYKKGVCADFSAFGRYAAHKHGYTSYDLILQFSNKSVTHSNAIYLVGSTLDYSSDREYYNVNYSTIQQIVNHWANLNEDYIVSSWYVNDYCNKVIDYAGITKSTKFYPIEGLYQTDTATFIGEEPINRSGTYQSGYTIINKGIPAQASGTVEKIAIWAYRSLRNVEVATFYEVSAGRYSTRDTQYIGSITGGSKREYSVNLDVRAGDLIGMYFTEGSVERSTSGYDGMWSASGDHIPCTNKSFASHSGYCISLGGLVISP